MLGAAAVRFLNAPAAQPGAAAILEETERELLQSKHQPLAADLIRPEALELLSLEEIERRYSLYGLAFWLAMRPGRHRFWG